MGFDFFLVDVVTQLEQQQEKPRMGKLHRSETRKKSESKRTDTL